MLTPNNNPTIKEFVNEFYELHSAEEVAQALNDMFHCALTSSELNELAGDKEASNWFATLRNVIALVEFLQPPEKQTKAPILLM